MSNSILLKIENQVAYITFNRPDVFNSFDREMALLLQATLDDCEKNSKVRSIVLNGKGKAFCAGQDLNEAIEDNGITFEVILNEHYNPIISRIRNIEKPVVAAVNGVAAGAGADCWPNQYGRNSLDQSGRDQPAAQRNHEDCDHCCSGALFQ